MYFVFNTYEEAQEALPQFDSELAQTLRERAAANRQYAADSFERCDTDGFLSQWAAGVTASENDRKANLADCGGLDIFPALLDENGNLHARIYTFPDRFRYNASCHMFKVQRGERAEWVNAYYKRESSYEKFGLRKVWIVAPAKVMRDPFNRMPEKTGLSGCAGYNGEHAQLDAEAAGL